MGKSLERPYEAFLAYKLIKVLVVPAFDGKNIKDLKEEKSRNR